VENQIDDFLNRKLNEAFPIIYKFIGNKTCSQIRSYFIAELEEIFPTLVNKYAGNLMCEVDMSELSRQSAVASRQLAVSSSQSKVHERIAASVAK
jgi:hypothetical protein